MHRAFRVGAGGEGVELAAAETLQDGFGHDRARRIAGAEEEHVVGAVGEVGHTALSSSREPQHAAGLVAACDSGAAPSTPPPYVVDSPVVRKVSHGTPCGSLIQDFSDLA